MYKFFFFFGKKGIIHFIKININIYNIKKNNNIINNNNLILKNKINNIINNYENIEEYSHKYLKFINNNEHFYIY
ncbi:septum formation initiator family protein [Candidatus Nardonella dryophthoridicola]|uniref:septum formation initiator family protein n=1 Tax=Candidatus Nardonella dryophthoridicola TaxID=1971485 RepID=UPI003B972E1E